MRQEFLSMKGVNTKRVIEKFNNFFQPNGRYVVSNNNVHVYIIEKYYYRIGAAVAAMILFEEKNSDHLMIHIAIAGGSDIFGVSLGAQNSMLKKIRKFFHGLID